MFLLKQALLRQQSLCRRVELCNPLHAPKYRWRVEFRSWINFTMLGIWSTESLSAQQAHDVGPEFQKPDEKARLMGSRPANLLLVVVMVSATGIPPTGKLGSQHTMQSRTRFEYEVVRQQRSTEAAQRAAHCC